MRIRETDVARAVIGRNAGFCVKPRMGSDEAETSQGAEGSDGPERSRQETEIKTNGMGRGTCFAERDLKP